MSDRKVLDKEVDLNEHVLIAQNRRAEGVKKNFAIGIQQVVAVESPGRDTRSRAGAEIRE